MLALGFGNNWGRHLHKHTWSLGCRITAPWFFRDESGNLKPCLSYVQDTQRHFIP